MHAAERRLIDTVGVGRIALTHDALPIVVVARCEMQCDRVLLRGDDPQLLRSAAAGDVAALQIDDLRADGAGHSLVITGVLAPAGHNAVTLEPSIVRRTELHLAPPSSPAVGHDHGSA
jgi:hypothetical protein